MGYLENLYSKNMMGGNYIPFTSLDILNENTGVYGNSGTIGGSTPPVYSPKVRGNDIRITFKNSTNFKNQMTFDVQGQTYQETNSVSIDSNTINDSLLIKPTINDGYISKNYFEFKKTINGITLNAYNENGDIQSTKDCILPLTIELGFDIEAAKPKRDPVVTKIQNISFVSNFLNADLINELKIRVTSNGVQYDLTNLGVKNDIDIIGYTIDDVKILVSGLAKFKPKNIRWQYASKFNSNSTFDINDFNIIGTNGIEVIIPANIFNNNIIVLIEVEPNDILYPKLTISDSYKNFNAKILESIFDSKTASADINIEFTLENSDSVRITTPYKEFVYDISTKAVDTKKITLDLKTHFLNNEGQFKILLTPYSNVFGDGITQPTIVTISKTFDVPIIDKIDYPTVVIIPIYSFGDVAFKIEYESNLATKILVYHTKEDDNYLLANGAAKTSYNSTYNNLKTFVKNGILDLLLVPYNGSIKGEIERISISFDDPGFYVSTQNLKDELFNAISSQLKLNLSKPKYLNHLASFDKDDKQIVISNWDVDNTTFTKFKTDELGNQIPDGQINKSVVIKLYEPLPTNINKNDTLWISELSALPILQSVVLSGVADDICIPLRAANFNIDIDFVGGQSTGFESYDNLILSGSQTSQQIVDKYLVENFIDVNGINIDYSNFSNFVKYSSAVERLANFRYKKELAELYQTNIDILSDSTSITAQLDSVNIETKKTNLLTGLDSWETYLTQSIFTGSFITSFNSYGQPEEYDSNTATLYTSYLNTAAEFDKNNNNALKNNIPLHIVEDNGNIDYLLFLDMIGNYFDIIWSYIKGMSDQKKIAETNTDGIEDKFLYQYLQSFGWNPKNLNSNKQLWDYTFGYNNSGVTGSFTSDEHLGENIELITPEKATHQVWRRIANNLPYLLKHKGSHRGIKALLTCYGIPSSNLSIMEFGGPNIDIVEDAPKFIYESLTHNLVFDNISASLEIPFTGTPKPQSIEFKFKPNEFENYMLLTGSGDFKLEIVKDTASSIIGSKYGYIRVNGSSVDSSYPFYDGNYHSILLNKSSSSVNVYAKTNDKDRIIHSGEWTKNITGSNYEATSTLSFTGFKGHLEEIRLWETNLSESVFNNHVIMPEAINGNHLHSSTQDLLLRLDFERPQNLASNRTINNIAPSLTYVAAVSASGFATASAYPFNYDVLEREVALTIPNSGASRYYTNKVRLESQELVNNLSPIKRATKKAFESSTKDSNRVGLFFSPNKDLDLDIAKSLGGESFDDFIGDPQYEYNTINYPELDNLRNYYFERVGERNLYEFIRLIKFYDKSLFVNLKEMLPVRAVTTTGLLIAPHLLERNRIKINRPEATAESLDGVITETQITDLSSTFDYKEANLNLTASIENISGVNETLDGTLIASNTYNFNAEVDSITTTINTDLENVADASYITYEGEIDFRLKDPTILTELDLNYGNSIIGFDRYSDYGYGTYFNNGYGKYFYEENGSVKSKGIRAFLVTKQNTILTQLTVNGVSGSEQNIVTSSYSQELIVQDFSASVGLKLNGKDKIVAITTASGYLPSHYIYKGDKHSGIENLFYRGCKQTSYIENGVTSSYTTIDGKSPVETFTTNPTTLRVTSQGRSNNEPILEVD